MMAEAMLALGRTDAVIPWVAFYSRRLLPEPECMEHDCAVSLKNWPEALGNDQFGAWASFFRKMLSAVHWKHVLRSWVPALARGAAAAAVHGVIRTGHAVRNLERCDTALRRRELSSGLAYWASRYQKLPCDEAAGTKKMRPREAIELVEILPRSKQRRYGLIGRRLEELEHFPPFRQVSSLIDTSADPASVLSNLTETFARVYLANASDLQSAIHFVHTVTGPAAVRSILPYLDRKGQETMLRFIWQAAAALYAALGANPVQEKNVTVPPGADELVEDALRCGDEHAVKFTEACLREYAMNPNPVYLAAARDAVNRMCEVSVLP
jgi:hypothetical protein